MITRKEDRKRRFIIDIVYFAIIAVISFLFVKYLLFWIMPFIIGFLIAIVVRPAVRFMNKKTGINIHFCGAFAVLLLAAIIILIVYLAASRAVAGLPVFARWLPEFASQLSVSLTGICQKLTESLKKMPHIPGVNIDTSLENISMQIIKITSLTEGIGKLIQSLFVSMPGLLFDIIVTAISACFISADYPEITGFIIRQLPERHRKTAVELKSFFLITVAKLIRAYLTLMLITFCELLIGLLLLRIQNAIALAAIIAIVDILPVLGTGTVMIPWVIIELIMGKFYEGLGLALLYAVIAIVRSILEPKIVGHHIGLYPLVTLAAMVIGLKSLGFAGMIFFPIAIIVLKHLRDSGIIKLWND